VVSYAAGHPELVAAVAGKQQDAVIQMAIENPELVGTLAQDPAI
jgi:hypothetical protein